MQFKNLPIRKKVGVVVLLLVVFNLLLDVVILYSNFANNDADLLNTAGRNRYLSQRLTALGNAATSNNTHVSKTAQKELIETMDLFEKNLTVLFKGGHPPKSNAGVVIDPAPKTVIPVLKGMRTYFKDTKANLEIVIKQVNLGNGEGPEAMTAINELNEGLVKGTMLKKAQEIVDAYTKNSEQNKFIVLTYVLLFTLLNFGVIIVVYYVFNKFISKPINQVKEISHVIASGDFTKKVVIDSTDDIGDVATSINTLITNMNKASDFADNIGQNKLDVTFESLGQNDTLGISLLTMRKNLIQVGEEEKKRNWSTVGLANFGDILRANNDSLETLSNNIISNLVKYLNANQGGLFVVNDNDVNDTYLELLACYAWNKKKYLHMRIERGEGLVGQAWQENDTLYITDVPEDFVKITSGLGGANPNSFLIVPLKVNEETFGVIEIASFNLFEKYQIEFVEKLAESIASTLSTAKTNERTKHLLSQSQLQTEAMRAQEEEMRQNMEEMQATQEEMERKEAEMSRMMEQMQQQEEEMRQNMEEMEATQEEMEKQNGIIAENAAKNAGILDGIDATMATIEFTPEGFVITANDNFTQTMKSDLVSIVGKHHSNFIPLEIKNSPEYQNFWTDLAKGNEKRGIFKRINAEGETVWLNAIYNPIRNAKGEVVNVIKFATDITEQKELEAQSNAQTDIINDIAIVSKTDLKGNITYVNDQFLKWSKYTKEEVMGKNHRMLKSGDQDDQIFVDMWKTISSGKVFRGEIKNKAKDGSFYWVDAIIAPIFDDLGKPKEYIAQRFVINEQKAKEQESGAQKIILDQVCIISKTDLKGNITYVNDQFVKWSQYSREEIMGKNHRILKSGEQDDQIFVDMWKTISSGKVFRGEIKNKAKDGSFYWVDAIVAPVLDDKGKPVEYMAQRFVINEQKEKEREAQQMLEETRAQEEEIRQTLEEVQATSEEMERVMREMDAQNSIINSVAIVSKTDLLGNITYVNDEFVKWAKYSRDEVLGKNHRILRHPDMPAAAFEDMWRTISSGKIWRGEVKNLAKDGSVYWVDAIIAPILDSNGKPKEYIAQRFVINDKKEKEAQLEALLKKK